MLAGHSDFRRRDEMRNEFIEKVGRKGGWEEGVDCLKGVQTIWSSSDYSYAVDGSCSEEQ